jgi:hypothetical protein
VPTSKRRLVFGLHAPPRAFHAAFKFTEHRHVPLAARAWNVTSSSRVSGRGGDFRKSYNKHVRPIQTVRSSPSKEQFVLDEDVAFDARLVDMIRGRPAGTKVSGAVRAGAHAFLREAAARPKGPKSRGGLPYLVNVSPVLRRAWLAAVERYANAVAEVLIEESGGKLSPLAAKSLGFSIAAIFAGIIDEIGHGTRQKANMGALVETLRAQIDHAVDRIAQGVNSAVEV